MRHYVIRLLTDAGYSVETVNDGEAALAAARANRPDLVLTDVMMPRLDGVGLLRAIRADADLRHLPVLMLSARAGEDPTTEGLDTGADDYLVKPFSRRELLARIRSTLKLAQMRREPAEELRSLNVTLSERIVERTAERDRIWQLSRELMAVCGPDGTTILAVNPAWTETLGWSEAELIGRKSIELMHPDDLAVTKTEVVRLTSGDETENFECRMRCADGSYRWTSWTAVPEADRVYAIGRDVTEQRRARDELAAANRQLVAQIEERERAESTIRQMQRLDAIGQLTSGVAHDFNNLLTVILGSVASLLRAGPGDAGFVRRTEMIRAAAERGANLTARLLAFSRQQRLEPTPLDLNQLVIGMEELLQTTLGSSVGVRTVLGPDLWPALVDATQLELAVLNLAINARDAMPDGGMLTIETAMEIVPERLSSAPEEPGQGEYVVVTVTDTGTGIQPEVARRVFEPFFTTKEPGKGSGLGLAQVFGFAKQSGGGVRLRTGIGAGTSVRVYVPRARGEAAVGDAAAAAKRSGELIGRPATVLLVDDDSSVREITRSLLEHTGYTVLEVGSGGAALDLLSHAHVDLLIVDFAMPGMNGMEVARRASALRPDLPVLFITGYADAEALSEVGSERIVAKPFRNGELEAKLLAVLRDSGAGVPLVRR